MDTSPSKRRVLGPVDVNARKPMAGLKPEVPKAIMSPTGLSQPDQSALKRPLNQEPLHQERPLVQPAKRQRTSISEDTQYSARDQEQAAIMDSRDNDGGNSRDSDAERQHSDFSDEEDSMFDNSMLDASQVTAITEPEVEVEVPVPFNPLSTVWVPTPRPRSTMTREETRQNVEKLRLRLRLAAYKVRTGQTDVPLEELKIKPLGPIGSFEPSLPPLPPRADAGAEDEEQRERPATATRKALPTAPSHRRGGSCGQAHPPPSKEPLMRPSSSKT
ncbi:hypothetical protein F4804DRAFT_259180 [Jackrogersella minutella]|nr:hypothetical protein F4804DRAFT_259180 [Jackrogersella minutella]